jgi:hypothetical protein
MVQVFLVLEHILSRRSRAMPSKLSKNQREGRVSLPAPVQPLNTSVLTDPRHGVTFARVPAHQDIPKWLRGANLSKLRKELPRPFTTGSLVRSPAQAELIEIDKRIGWVRPRKCE